jgi:small subunit ribosomal protein S6
MLILRADVEDEARTAVLDRVKDILASRQGVWGKIDEWGKRRFAYEIDHMTEGVYYVLYFEADAAALDEVTRVLGITDAVVRYMPVRLDDVEQELTAVSAAPAVEDAPEE